MSNLAAICNLILIGLVIAAAGVNAQPLGLILSCAFGACAPFLYNWMRQ